MQAEEFSSLQGVLKQSLEDLRYQSDYQLCGLYWFGNGSLVPVPAEGNTYRTSYVAWMGCTIFGVHAICAIEFGLASLHGNAAALVRERVVARAQLLKDFVVARLRGEEVEPPPGVAIVEDCGTLPRL